ncbi:ATP-binding cassette domain-containing protein [Streptomyces sp. DSM 44915]|uniref:ATP-binding cassette domain-containing protein n=1 Tax=Streptomyces chisholmiae TaxID=3075540 RepID=A0ABU2JVI5_9ACTN|nr:ATP-binding cassette domain-containing protein [Streptomyces sp. DSM 44915]MDT0268995.1 ATP-binding cassette domain-containing protein [Streptomyces sp. DSM 44915]
MGTLAVRLTGATRRLGPAGRSRAVLDNLELTVERDEFLVVVGPSGSGKSTLLRILAGLEPLDAGTLARPDRPTAEGPPPPIGVVFQQPLLYPWLTVRQNIALGQRYRANRDRFDATAVDELLDRLGLDGLGDAWPDQLSGGQAQRVAVARAVVVRPDILLLDEPFSALDPATRATLQDWLREIVAALGLTVVLVTHDVDEALYLGRRIALLDGSGRVAATWDHQPPADRAAVRDDPLRARVLAGYRTDGTPAEVTAG